MSSGFTDQLEERMARSIAVALRPLLFAFEEQDVVTQAENDAILDKVARAAWRSFIEECAKQNEKRGTP